MRELNFRSVPSNRAAVSITTTLYDRRALDCTANRPLVNSLNHLTYLASSSARVRETLCVDGGLERLVSILKECRDDFHNESQSKEQVMLTAWKWTLALQCLVFLGTRGTEQIRGRVVDAGLIPVITTILDNYLYTIEKNKGLVKGKIVGNRRYMSGHTTAAAALSTAALVEDTPRSVGSASASNSSGTVSSNGTGSTNTSGGSVNSDINPFIPFSNHLRPVNSNNSTDSSAASVFSLASMSSSVSSVSSLDSLDTQIEGVGLQQNIPYYQQRMGGGNAQVPTQQQPNDRRPMSTSATINSSFAQNVLVTASTVPANSLRTNQPNPRLPPLHSQASNAVFHTHVRVSPITLQTPVNLDQRVQQRVQQLEQELQQQDRQQQQLQQLHLQPIPPLRPHHDHNHGHNHSHSHNHGHNRNHSHHHQFDPMRSVSPESSNLPEDNEDYDSSSTITNPTSTSISTAIVDPESINEDDNPLSSWTDIVIRPQENEEQQLQRQQFPFQGQLQQLTPQQQQQLQPQLQLQAQFQLPLRQTQGALQIATSVNRNDNTNNAGIIGGTAAAAATGTTTATATPATNMGPAATTTATTPDPTSRGNSVTSVASAVSAVPRQFRDHVIVTREEDIIWALEILAFVSKYAYLKTSLQTSHLVPKLSVRDAARPPLVKPSNIRSAESNDTMDIDESTLPSSPSSPSSTHTTTNTMPRSSYWNYDEYDFEDEKDIEPEYLGEAMNIFPLVEKFTVKQFPKEIQYWAGVIMRNSCRRNESLGGIRQCANFECGKWEEYPRQFAKCRRCKRTKYCSKDCQLQAWNFHRHWCTPSGAGSSTSSGSSSSRHQHAAANATSTIRTGVVTINTPTQQQQQQQPLTTVESTTTS